MYMLDFVLLQYHTINIKESHFINFEVTHNLSDSDIL